MKTIRVGLFLATALALIGIPQLVVFSATPKVGITAGPQESVSVHLTLGNPSGATTDTTSSDNFLIVKSQYTLSYNNTKGGPNWVSWHLQASDIGDQSRGDFSC
jgi:DNA/RNA endonuclease G (NUC1)